MLRLWLVFLALIVLGGCTRPVGEPAVATSASAAESPAAVAAPPGAGPRPATDPAEPSTPLATAFPTVVGTPTPDAIAQLTADERAALARGQKLVLAGDYSAAVEYFERLAREGGTAVSLEARLRLAAALLRTGETARAGDLAEALQRDAPASEQAHLAGYLLAEVQAALGQLDNAALQLSAVARSHPELAPLLRLRQARWALQAGQADQASRAAEAGLKDAVPLRLRLALLTTLGRARLAAHDPQGAYETLREAVALAPSESFWEELRAVADAYRAGDRPEAARTALEGIARDFPNAAASTQAQIQLDMLGHSTGLDNYRLGRLRYIASDYHGALEALDRYLKEWPPGADVDWARLYRGLALSALGETDAALQVFEQLARQASDELVAARAALEAGRVHEHDWSFDQAAAVYGLVQPGSRLGRTDPGQEALFRRGLALFVKGNFSSALALWQGLLASGASEKARLLYWSAKAYYQLDQLEASRASLEAASQLRPRDYYTWRAVWNMRTAGQAATRLGQGDLERDEQALELWLRDRGLDLDEARRAVEADPAVQRARLLVRLGLYREAGWEADDLLERLVTGERLYAAADLFEQLGLYHDSTRLAQAAVRLLVGNDPAAAPPALARAAHPLAFADLVWPVAEREGIDPLLLTALLFQESTFDPFAQSGAGARGLAQIMPATAAGLARALGEANFTGERLYLPAVSVRFGATYLSQRLKRFDGEPVLALAGYNAGEGTVTRWLRPELDDPDVFAEYIPFRETREYVRRVLAYWEEYRALYEKPA